MILILMVEGGSTTGRTGWSHQSIQSTSSLHHQDQDHRSPREEVLCMDWWLHPVLPVYLPADVDLQAGVRRVRTFHCPPQVLLNIYLQPTLLYYCQLYYCFFDD